MPKRVAEPANQEHASSPSLASSDVDIDEICSDISTGRIVMYDIASKLEAAVLLRELKTRSKSPPSPTTPTPLSNKPRSSSPLMLLELPSRLRMNLTPTKKASRTVHNAIVARKNRFIRDAVDDASRPGLSIRSSRDSSIKESSDDNSGSRGSHASSSNGGSQSHAETTAHVPDMPPAVSDDEKTPVWVQIHY